MNVITRGESFAERQAKLCLNNNAHRCERIIIARAKCARDQNVQIYQNALTAAAAKNKHDRWVDLYKHARALKTCFENVNLNVPS